MSLERLSNELLFDIFEFLTTPEILNAFCCLNSRFNALLLVHVNQYGFNFQSVSKQNFNFLCQKQLPSIANQITALRLSEDDETPQQLDLFLSSGLTLRQFTSLQSLSLYQLRSGEILQKLMIGWPYLLQLIHLKLIECYVETVQPNCRGIINNIWSLSKLAHCYLDINFKHEDCLTPITIVSSSLKYLTIKHINCCLFELARLFQHTPHLEQISIQSSDSDDRRLLPILPSIIAITLCIDKSDQMIRNLLQNTPNLNHLTVRLMTIHLTGHQWEQIITNNLPQLKVFQLDMNFSLRNTACEQQVDNLLDSFRSPFWLKERKWYIRCHWFSPTAGDRFFSISCYTLPYAFSDFSYIANVLSKSTCPTSDNNYWFYNHVYSLHCDSFSLSPISTSSKARFSNIHHLTTHSRLDDWFWSIIPRFYRLKSLEVSTSSVSMASIQALLNRAPQLYSMTSENIALTLKSASIRRLNLQKYCTRLNSQQCDKLSHSALGRQCEILLINVEKEQIY